MRQSEVVGGCLVGAHALTHSLPTDSARVSERVSECECEWERGFGF